MPVPTPVDFWRWLALFAYRRWAGGGRATMPVGVPGNRDPDHPCTAYEPLPRGRGEWGGCQSDGHYLCSGCCHYRSAEDALNPTAEEQAALEA